MSAVGAPAPRYRHTAVWTGTEMIVWGGTVIDPTNTGARYNPSTDTWTPTAVSASVSAVADHTAVWTGSKMVVWGGQAIVGPIIGGVYDPVTNTWTTVSTVNAPRDRYLHTAVWTGSRMIVWGGVSAESNAGGIYDPATNTWVGTTNVGSETPTGRAGHSAVWTGSKMIVWGGGPKHGRGVRPAHEHLDRNEPRQRALRTNRADGRLDRRPDDRVGGASSTGFNTGGRYDPATNTWAATGVGPNVPSARDRHSAIWTGTEMIVWGGRLSTPSIKETYRNGGRYNPVTDSWTATATSTAVPAARYQHEGIWTGAELIVWGGATKTQNTPPTHLLSSGGRYDPATDSWTGLGTVNAPSGRTGFTVVWTGVEMIVWGGDPNLITGGRYDPQANVWRPTTISGAASGRDHHVAVWTGTRMLVWGGDPSPAANTTRSLTRGPRISAPPGGTAARESISAIWTGTEMIVFGGNASPTGATNVGRRYNPVTNVWTLTSVGAGVPAPRYAHAAVWTGSRMIVWGGKDDSVLLASGGIYDPATDTWQPTTSLNVPTARYGAEVVWTGDRMLVWGGQGTLLQGLFNDGTRYDPVGDTGPR
jgi:N-acetylneuraminic acid mutarotase